MVCRSFYTFSFNHLKLTSSNTNQFFFILFKSVFGDKLLKNYLSDCDIFDDALLPSPNQLKYKILIKNKKLQKPINISTLPSALAASSILGVNSTISQSDVKISTPAAVNTSFGNA